MSEPTPAADYVDCTCGHAIDSHDLAGCFPACGCSRPGPARAAEQEHVVVVDLCVSCSSVVKTFANLQIVHDEKHLAPRWVPPGGCTCSILEVHPDCRLCFAPALLCRACGDADV